MPVTKLSPEPLSPEQVQHMVLVPGNHVRRHGASSALLRSEAEGPVDHLIAGEAVPQPEERRPRDAVHAVADVAQRVVDVVILGAVRRDLECGCALHAPLAVKPKPLARRSDASSKELSEPGCGSYTLAAPHQSRPSTGKMLRGKVNPDDACIA